MNSMSVACFFFDAKQKKKMAWASMNDAILRIATSSINSKITKFLLAGFIDGDGTFSTNKFVCHVIFFFCFAWKKITSN